MSRLTVEHASYSYDGEVPVFADLNLSIKSGDIMCILGPNGTGKSTLLKCILKLLPFGSGRVLIDGEDFYSFDAKRAAREISYIQQTYQLAFPYRVLDMVVMGRNPHLNSLSKPSEEDYQKAFDALASFGLEKLVDRPCNQLSGGQFQQVMLARSIAQEANFLFLDEPTAHLDFGKQMKTLEVIDALRDRGVGVVMTTHTPDHAFMVADSVAILNEGRFVAVGAPTAVITERNLEAVYGVEVHLLDSGFGDGSKVCVPAMRRSSCSFSASE